MEEIEKFYRGESKNNETRCMPSVFRNIIKDKNILQKESDYYNECIKFLIENKIVNSTENYSDKNFVEALSDIKHLGYLQHYGFSTRLLDVTSNKDIAYYFASCNNFDSDGYIYKFDNTNIKIMKTEDTKTVKRKIECIRNYSKLKYYNLVNYFVKKDNEDIENSKKKKDNINHSTIENNVILDYTKVFATTSENVRYEKQSGSFVLFGPKLNSENIMLDKMNFLDLNFFENRNNYQKVPSSEKIKELIELNEKDINYVNIYPDAELSYKIVSKYSQLNLYRNDEENLNNIFKSYVRDIYNISKYDVCFVEKDLIIYLLDNKNIFYFFSKELIDIYKFYKFDILSIILTKFNFIQFYNNLKNRHMEKRNYEFK